MPYLLTIEEAEELLPGLKDMKIEIPKDAVLNPPMNGESNPNWRGGITRPQIRGERWWAIYYNTPEQKAKRKKYRQRPAVKEYYKEYTQRPEVKESIKVYRQTPEQKAKKKEYDKALYKKYRQAPKPL